MVFTINVYKGDADFSYSAESTLYIFSLKKKHLNITQLEPSIISYYEIGFTLAPRNLAFVTSESVWLTE